MPGGKNTSKDNQASVPLNINVNDGPPTVPLQEDITLGTIGKTQSWRAAVMDEHNVGNSDRFEPRYIGTPTEQQKQHLQQQQQNGANSNSNSNSNIISVDSRDASVGDQNINTSNDEAHYNFRVNDQQSLTVASSTYGEDRQKVVNHNLLDPYGDKGCYTGLILKSTGMPHGSGRMVYEEDKRIYEGEWRHGRWHGFGRAKFANGDSYEGQYRFDQRHGQGKYSWADGRSYDGDFSEDRRHGKGLFVWPDGAIYVSRYTIIIFVARCICVCVFVHMSRDYFRQLYVFADT